MNLVLEAADMNNELTWNTTRTISFYSAAGHIKKGTTIKKFMKLPWDNKTRKQDNKPMDKNRYKRIAAKTKNIVNGKR